MFFVRSGVKRGKKTWGVVQCFFFNMFVQVYLFVLDFYLLIFRGERKDKERERLPLTWPPLGTWPATEACALTGNQTSNPLVCRSMLSSLSYSNQGVFSVFNTWG